MSDSGSGDEDSYDPTKLFTNEDGTALRFHILTDPEYAGLNGFSEDEAQIAAEDIEAHGGEIELDRETAVDVVLVKRDLVPIRETYCLEGSMSKSWKRHTRVECRAWVRLCKQRQHVLRPRVEKSYVDPRRHRGHTAFTDEDGRKLRLWLAYATPSGCNRTGYGVYEHLIAQGKVHPNMAWTKRHTVHSWRTFYIKNKSEWDLMMAGTVEGILSAEGEDAFKGTIYHSKRKRPETDGSDEEQNLEGDEEEPPLKRRSNPKPRPKRQRRLIKPFKPHPEAEKEEEGGEDPAQEENMAAAEEVEEGEEEAPAPLVSYVEEMEPITHDFGDGEGGQQEHSPSGSRHWPPRRSRGHSRTVDTSQTTAVNPTQHSPTLSNTSPKTTSTTRPMQLRRVDENAIAGPSRLPQPPISSHPPPSSTKKRKAPSPSREPSAPTLDLRRYEKRRRATEPFPTVRRALVPSPLRNAHVASRASSSRSVTPADPPLVEQASSVEEEGEDEDAASPVADLPVEQPSSAEEEEEEEEEEEAPLPPPPVVDPPYRNTRASSRARSVEPFFPVQLDNVRLRRRRAKAKTPPPAVAEEVEEADEEEGIGLLKSEVLEEDRDEVVPGPNTLEDEDEVMGLIGLGTRGADEESGGEDEEEDQEFGQPEREAEQEFGVDADQEFGVGDNQPTAVSQEFGGDAEMDSDDAETDNALRPRSLTPVLQREEEEEESESESGSGSSDSESSESEADKDTKEALRRRMSDQVERAPLAGTPARRTRRQRPSSTSPSEDREEFPTPGTKARELVDVVKRMPNSREVSTTTRAATLLQARKGRLIR